VTCTGVHGANRLASNSLTESVVAGTRVGRDLAWELPDRVELEHGWGDAITAPLLEASRVREVRAVMSRHVGVVRSESSLSAAAGALGSLARGLPGEVHPSRRAWEGTNMLTLASAVVASAQARTESRGCHRRSDFPAPDDRWLTHLDVTVDAVGATDVAGMPSVIEMRP
jgi:L-aspartate oxidase